MTRTALVWWRTVQHRAGWHQWRTMEPDGAPRPWRRCDWCGANRELDP